MNPLNAILIGLEQQLRLQKLVDETALQHLSRLQKTAHGGDEPSDICSQTDLYFLIDLVVRYPFLISVSGRTRQQVPALLYCLDLAVGDVRVESYVIEKAIQIMCASDHIPAKKVAIFGASFNPTTRGHIDLIQLLLKGHPDAYDLVRLMPTGQSPLKPAHQYASITDRLRLLQMMLDAHVDPCDRRRLCVEHLEVDRSAPSRMVVTLSALVLLHHGQERYTLACGYDHVSQLSQWYRWQDLKHLCELVFYPRQGVTLLTEQHVLCLITLSQAGLGLKIVFSESVHKGAFYEFCRTRLDTLQMTWIAKITLVDDPTVCIASSSATAIRAYYQQAQTHAAIPEGLTPEVHRYILKHRCYL